MQLGLKRFKIYPHVSAEGQALIEFAIILLLVVLVVGGGAELAIAAYGSSKVSEAAKAGATEWGQMISHTNDTDRDGTCAVNNICTNVAVRGSLTGTFSDGSVTGSFTGTFNGIVTELTPSASTGVVIGDVNGQFTDSLGIVYTLTGAATSSLSGLTTNTSTNLLTGDLTIVYFSSGTYTNTNTAIETSIPANASIIPTSPLTVSGTNLDLDKQGDVGLGDHSVANFQSPSCVALNGDSADYDDGIPDDRYLLDKNHRDNYLALDLAVAPPNNTKSIYLFNPLPIDHESCFGTDPNRGDRSRISILINGYGLMFDNAGIPNPLYVPGLPKVNQAMYSMYQQVCLNAGNALARCENADERLLFPPGKLCLGTGVDEENCPTDTDNLGETGYYFFGASNSAARGSKQYIPSLPSLVPEFSPTFQIECPGGSYKDSDNMAGCDDRINPLNICWSATTVSLACQLRVHVRYRSIFESFITFGLAELPDAALSNLPFFYNPSKVGVAVKSVSGIAGSEIGPIGATGNPTVKPFKDFRGCYESVNPGSLNYQVISCN